MVVKNYMVYIVVLNWNNAEDTIACLGTLLGLRNTEFKIIVCDNNSTDNSYQKIKNWMNTFDTSSMQVVEVNDVKSFTTNAVCKEYSAGDMFLIQTGNNLGYAGGNNVGIRFALNQSDMSYVWILNNDTEVDAAALYELIAFSKRNHIGLCGSKLVYHHDRSILQGLGGIYNPIFCTVKHYAELEPSDSVYDDLVVSESIDYVIGASMLIRRDVLESIGLLCEDYFLYYEELDYCARIAGLFKIGVATQSIVYHKEGASMVDEVSDISDYYAVTNRLRFTSRFHKKYIVTVYFSFLLCILNRLLRKQYKKAFRIIKYMFGLKSYSFIK